jgi:hypothetical protein
MHLSQRGAAAMSDVDASLPLRDAAMSDVDASLPEGSRGGGASSKTRAC